MSRDGFPRAAVAALADPQLRRNLRAATHTIRRNRAAAVAELVTGGASRRDAVDVVAARHGLARRVVYAAAAGQRRGKDPEKPSSIRR